ncbi:MAG: hypothetical protein RL095_2204 [Verrucomicrobiota bacterium]|jgi:hypothetical protein
MRRVPILFIALIFSCHQEAPTPPRPGLSFAVSAVKLAEKPLPTQSPQELFAQLAGKDLEASGGFDGQELLADTSAPNAFVQAAHLSFAEHRPLVLTPDCIWLLINQMAARRILAAPEECRAALTRNPQSAGKEELIVRRDNFILGSPNNDWRGVFAEFESKIEERCPKPSFVSDFSHPFSSSSVDTVAARRVTLMKGFSAYYTYTVATLCGIPEIRLEGKPEDWDWIRDHVDDLKLLKMDAQVAVLKPILEQFCAASRGQVDPAFWQSFYKFESESGGPFITGWIMVFLRDEISFFAHLREEKIDWRSSLQKHRIAFASVPRGDVVQDFKWDYLGKELKMQFRAGFLGVSQDGITLRPEISWLTQHRRVDSHLTGLAGYLGQQTHVSPSWEGPKYLWAESQGWQAPADPELDALRQAMEKDGRSGNGKGFVEKLDKCNSLAEIRSNKLYDQRQDAYFKNRRKFQDDVLPLMTGMEEFKLSDWQEARLDFTPADAELLIKLPNLKRVIGNFDAECLEVFKKKAGLEIHR